MAGSSTVTSQTRNATTVTKTAEAVAQVFAGGDPADFSEVHFAQKLCHRRRGTLELDRKGRRGAPGGVIEADILTD